MLPITFNPWSTKYKYPFGAVSESDTVQICLEASVPNGQIEHVAFVYHQNQASDQTITMEWDAKQQLYKTHFHLERGLYFYHFQITYQQEGYRKIGYYIKGDQQNGEGKFVEQAHQINEFQLTCFKHEAICSWFETSVAYQIFPDRFSSHLPPYQLLTERENIFLYGSHSDRPMYIKNEKGEVTRWDFYGGTLKGIEEKIPYLVDLGVKIVYLNPIFEANSNHRYDTSDYFEIDPLLGSKEDFLSLLDHLHQAGIRLILDGVFSHVGRNSRYFNQDGRYGETTGASRSRQSKYYPWFQFTDYPTEYQSWWGIHDLPQIDKTQESFRDFIYRSKDSVIRYWTDLGVDGWRLDVADELPDEFIEGIRQVLDEYDDRILIGEVWEDASNKIAYDQRRRYVQGENLNGVMNYPFREAILKLINTKEVAVISKQLQTILENYPQPFLHQSLNNLGTHDTKRLRTELDGSLNNVYLAFAVMFALPGTPCIYYGDEVGVLGQADPDNRSYYPWETFDHHLYYQMKQLIHYRTTHEPLQKGDTYLFYSDTIFGCLRHYENKYTIFMMNLTDRQIDHPFADVHWLRDQPMQIELYQALTQTLTKLEKNSFLFATFSEIDRKIEVYHGKKQETNTYTMD